MVLLRTERFFGEPKKVFLWHCCKNNPFVTFIFKSLYKTNTSATIWLVAFCNQMISSLMRLHVNLTSPTLICPADMKMSMGSGFVSAWSPTRTYSLGRHTKPFGKLVTGSPVRGFPPRPYVALQRCRVHIDVTVRPVLSTPTLRAYCKPEKRENKNRNHANAHASKPRTCKPPHTQLYTMQKHYRKDCICVRNTHTQPTSEYFSISNIAFEVFISDKRGRGPLRVAWLKIVFWASGTEGNNLMRAPSDRSEIPLKYTLISFQLCALIGEDHQSRIIHKETYMLQISRDLSNKRLVQERTRP